MINSSSVGWNLKPGGRSDLALPSINLFKVYQNFGTVFFFGISWTTRIRRKQEKKGIERNVGVFEMFNQRGLGLLWLSFFCRFMLVQGFDWLFL